MEPIYKWTRDYFIKNEEECIKKLKQENLSLEEKIELRSNLNFKENGSLILLNHFMISDIHEPEFYCDKYEVKQRDGIIRHETAKYSDKLNVLDGETCENPAEVLSERQVCIITESNTNNSWIKDYNSISMNTNKRKIENVQEEKSFLLKTYDGVEMKLNEYVEVIGFLYPSHNIKSDAMDEDEDDTPQAKLPPYTIHAICCKEVNHNNPILIHEVDDIQQDQSMHEIHQDLLKLFTQFLFGDELCANYMICHLISCVYSRVNDEALGKFSLNLITHSIPTEVISDYIKKLYNLMEILMPNSMYFPLTIENLNTESFVPKKDYTANCLSSGVLQIPKNTHLVLDETKLENGKLDNAGCLAVQDLSELIRSQQLSYDFQFYKIPFKTDIPVLIISEGKSFLPVSLLVVKIIFNFLTCLIHLQSDFAIPIKPQDADSVRLINENFAAGLHYMRPKLNAYRRYLTKCRMQQFDINEDEIKMIETDFVKIRESLKNFQVENLHSLLVLSRLLGISKGLTRLDMESWESAKKFEIERSARMEKRNVNEP